MATPVLRAMRTAFPGAFLGGLVRPGIDQLLAGTNFFDELHTERASGVLGPKFVAAKLRPRRYDTAVLLTNSFSTALIARIAGIPRRIGYDRDARGLLLTDRVKPRVNADGSWAILSAIDYYRELVTRTLLPTLTQEPAGVMELATTPAEEAAAHELLTRAGVEIAISASARDTNDSSRAVARVMHAGVSYSGLAVLNPGGNNPAKRWPAERFATLAAYLTRERNLLCTINGSPAEAELCEAIAHGAQVHTIVLPQHGITLGSLKPLVRRAALMVTNDTGPRHIAAAFGVPLVSLFGPTDPRWTTIPTRPGGPEIVLTADPELPPELVADEHPQRCRIERIEFERVRAACERVLEAVL